MPLPLSTYRRAGNQLLTSGLTALQPDGSIASSLSEQMDISFRTLTQALIDNELSPSDVVSVQVYLADITDFDEMNERYAVYFQSPYPVRTTIACALYPGVLFEISAVVDASDSEVER